MKRDVRGDDSQIGRRYAKQRENLRIQDSAEVESWPAWTAGGAGAIPFEAAPYVTSRQSVTVTVIHDEWT